MPACLIMVSPEPKRHREIGMRAERKSRVQNNILADGGGAVERSHLGLTSEGEEAVEEAEEGGRGFNRTQPSPVAVGAKTESAAALCARAHLEAKCE